MDQTMTEASPRTGPANAQARYQALQLWWAGLTERGRGAARLALNGEDILPALFLELADAGVLAVDDELRGSVRFGGPTFAMPADIGAYIEQHTPGHGRPGQGPSDGGPGSSSRPCLRRSLEGGGRWAVMSTRVAEIGGLS